MDFKSLRTKVERLAQEKARAEGVMGTLLERLSTEFDVESVQEGEKLLETLRVKAKKEKKKLDQAIQKFEERWGDVLEEDDDED